MLESKSISAVSTSTNFLEAQTGISYVRLFEDNCITFSVNNIVANTAKEEDVIKSREKVVSHVIALEMLIGILTKTVS